MSLGPSSRAAASTGVAWLLACDVSVRRGTRVDIASVVTAVDST